MSYSSYISIIKAESEKQTIKICIYINKYIDTFFFQLRDLLQEIAFIQWWNCKSGLNNLWKAVLCSWCWSLESTGPAVKKGRWMESGEAGISQNPRTQTGTRVASNFDDANVLLEKLCFTHQAPLLHWNASPTSA